MAAEDSRTVHPGTTVGPLLLVCLLLSTAAFMAAAARQQGSAQHSPDGPTGRRDTAGLRTAPSELARVDRSEQCEYVFSDLAAGTIIVVGSLDVSAGLHTICLTGGRIESGDPSQTATQNMACDAESAPPAAELKRRKERGAMSFAVPHTQTSAEALRSIDKMSRPLSTAVTSAGASAVSEHRQFLVPAFTDQGSAQKLLTARRLAVSERVAVYGVCSGRPDSVESAVPSRCDYADRVCDVLETQVLSAVEGLLQPISDVDLDEHLTVVLTELDQRQVSQEAPIRGCVRAADLMSSEAFRGDIIYLDDDILNPVELRAVLAHETAHVAVYSACLHHETTKESVSATALPVMPGWMNEAIAHCIERSLEPDSENFRQRLVAFHQNTNLCPVICAEDGMPLMLRRGGTRAAATLFIESLLSDPEELRGLLDFRRAPIERLESLSQMSFSMAFRRWSCQTALKCADGIESDQRVAGGGLLPVRQDSRDVVSLRGTAFRAFEVSEFVDRLTMVSPVAADLQVTILTPDLRTQQISCRGN